MIKETIIIAPHCDDEIIGCYSILDDKTINPLIIYTEPTTVERQKEAMKIKEHFSIRGQMYCQSIPASFLNPNNRFYFPGPDEIHPAHRRQAAVGEGLARQGLDVIFYTTNMNVPWIREVTNNTEKFNTLQDIYPSQSELWRYEHKYYIFEGFCKWLF